MLDLNRYLSIIDYELEIECLEWFCKQAYGILTLIRAFLKLDFEKETVSRPEHFFRVLSVNGGGDFV